MPVDVIVTTLGITNSVNALNRKQDLIEKKYNSALNTIGRRIESSVKSKAPVKTGALRSSIQYFVEKNGVIVGVPANSKAGKYANVVNEKHKKKKKYLENGVITQYNEIVKILEGIVK